MIAKGITRRGTALLLSLLLVVVTVFTVFAQGADPQSEARGEELTGGDPTETGAENGGTFPPVIGQDNAHTAADAAPTDEEEPEAETRVRSSGLQPTGGAVQSDNRVVIGMLAGGGLQQEIVELVDGGQIVLSQIEELEIQGGEIWDEDWAFLSDPADPYHPENLMELRVRNAVSPSDIPEGAFVGTNVRVLDLKGLSLDHIADETFKGNGTLERVYLPTGLQTIGIQAFYGCANLVEADFTQCQILTGIGREAFRETAIEELDLSDCAMIRQFRLEGDNEEKQSTFYGCSRLVKVVMPPYLEVVDNRAFDACVNLAEVFFSGTAVTDIDDAAFYSSGVKDINLSDLVNLRRIGYAAFMNASLETAILPGKVEELGQFAFYGCESLVYMEIPAGVTELPNQSLGGFLGSLYGTHRSIKLLNEEQVVELSTFTFFGVDNTVVRVPAHLLDEYKAHSVWSTQSSKLTLLPYASVEPEVTVDVAAPGALEEALEGYELMAIRKLTVTGSLNDADLAYIKEYLSHVQHFVISASIVGGVLPDEQFQWANALRTVDLTGSAGLKEIGSSAFYRCPSLEQVLLPDSVEAIGDYAFSYCSNLKSFDFPPNATAGDNGMFGHCTSLERVTLGSVTNLGQNFFLGCSSLREVVLPPSVESLGRMAFSGITDMTLRIEKQDGIVKTDYTAFDIDSNTTIYVPAQLYTAYKEASQWRNMEEIGRGTLVPYGESAAAEPVITRQPAGGSILRGETWLMEVQATSPDDGALSYQWYQDGTAVTGAVQSGYTTPNTLETGSYNYHVVVTNTLDGTTAQAISDTAVVSVTDPPVTPTVDTVTVNPQSTSVQKGNTQQFTATVTGSNNPAQTVTWSVTGGGAGTEISSGGLLRVADNESAATLTVRATSTVDDAKSGTATVTVTAQPVTPTVDTVTVNPQSTSVQKGNTQQFTATVTGSNNPAQTVTWSVTGGGAGTEISSGGLLRVADNESATSLTVRATSTVDDDKSGTATVTVTAQTVTPTVDTVTVNPQSTSVQKGETQQFSATVTGSNNPDQTVTWSVTGGGAGTEISSGGLLRVADNESAASLTVRATSTVDDDKSGTATVTVTAQPVTPTVDTVTVNPQSTSVQKGNTQQFTATVTGSNNPDQTVTWSVTGGGAGTEISSGGLLRVADNESAATLTVRATSTVDDAKSGTATVTVTDLPAATHTLTVTAGTGGSVNSAGGSYRAGDEIVLVATARDGYRFTGWTSSNGGSFADASASTSRFTMPAADTTVQASFQPVGGNNAGSAGSTTRSSGGGGGSNTGVADAALSVRGAGQSWSDGTEGLTFTVEGVTPAALLSVRVDGEVLDPDHYTVRAGSVILTLPPAYLESLAAGEYTLTMQFWNSTATARFTVSPTGSGGADGGTPPEAGGPGGINDNPSTGVPRGVGAAWLAMLVAAGGLAGTARRRR